MVSSPHTLSRSDCKCPRPNGPRTREELSTIYTYLHMTRMIYRVTFIARRSSTLYQCIYCFQGRGGLHARLPPLPPGAQKVLDFRGDPPGATNLDFCELFLFQKVERKHRIKSLII